MSSLSQTSPARFSTFGLVGSLLQFCACGLQVVPGLLQFGIEAQRGFEFRRGFPEAAETGQHRTKIAVHRRVVLSELQRLAPVRDRLFEAALLSAHVAQ